MIEWGVFKLISRRASRGDAFYASLLVASAVPLPGSVWLLVTAVFAAQGRFGMQTPKRRK